MNNKINNNKEYKVNLLKIFLHNNQFNKLINKVFHNQLIKILNNQ